MSVVLPGLQARYPDPFDFRQSAEAFWWTPELLGSQLVGFIDFERYADEDSVVDLVSGAAFTAAGTDLHLGVGANGRQCAIFNGTDDYFTAEPVPDGWPTGASPGGIFAVVNQIDPASSVVSRVVLQYGAGGSLADALNGCRRVLRVISGGINRVRSATGSGAASTNVTNSSVDFTGRHTTHGIFGATESNIEIDGVPATAANVVPSTGTDRAVIGATSSDTAASFWIGDISAVLVYTGTLSATDLARLNAWAATRT